jgi:DNA invertase Pin-like site-specific DNA recombinase
LFLGTHQDNRADAVSKKRHAVGDRTTYRRYPHLVQPVMGGTNNCNARLDEKQVIEILALGGSMKQREIAARYGVHQHTVWAILKRKAWRHVTV